jgi:iron complex transport system ATP-binding protein
VTEIALEGLAVRYGQRFVVEDVDLKIPAGSWEGLIGPNGAGKTTLLKALAGLVEHRGVVRLDGGPAVDRGRRAIARAIAYVPQRPVLPPEMTVHEYVLLGRTPHLSYFGTEGRLDLEIAAEVLDRLDLSSLRDRPLGTLSGGEFQRVLLGRALAQQAPILLLDEPTSALDVGHQLSVLELVDELRRERSLTVLSAMHDLTLAGQFADRLYLLDRGRVVASGPAPSVLTAGAIRRHYGASVEVLQSEHGVVVIPTRLRRGAHPEREVGG